MAAGGNWIRDKRAVAAFEEEARHFRLPFEKESLDGETGLRYRVPIDVPGSAEGRRLTIEIRPARPQPPSPRVFIDGPVCLRHRFPQDQALCMWLASDPPNRRWLHEDGLSGLVAYGIEHAFCETRCRRRLPWPKTEAPGLHPRPPGCPSCPPHS